MKKELTKEDIQLLEEIKGYKKVSNDEVKNMQYFMTNFIDPKTHICPHCSGQIRFAHKRIINWAAINNKLINSILNPDDNIKTCNECGIELTDKRRKTCKDCKDK